VDIPGGEEGSSALIVDSGKLIVTGSAKVWVDAPHVRSLLVGRFGRRGRIDTLATEASARSRWAHRFLAA